VSSVVLISSVSQYGYFYGFCNAAFIFSLFFLPRNTFSAVGDHGLLVASLNCRHEAVSISGLAGKKQRTRASCE